MSYGLYDKPPLGTTLLSALQWLIVTLSSSVIVPIVVGDVYGLEPNETDRFMQQTIFFVGVVSFVQVWLGHRYPMMEAPAGLWWSIFVVLGQIGISVGVDPRQIGQSLQTGLLVAGGLFLLLGYTGWIGKIQKWFTPLVSGTYMVLLAVSLCSSFMSGMLGIGYRSEEQVQPAIAFVSLGIVSLVFLLLQVRRVASFAVLLGMVVGWGTYALLGWTEPVGQTGQLVLLPTLFFWGPMRWDWSVVLTSVLTGFVLLTNLIASLSVIGRATERQATPQQFNRAGVFTGLSHMLSGVAGVVGMIPLSLAAAVIQTTRMAARLPFMIAMVLMMVIGVLPGVSQFLAALPTPVAYAAMFVSFAQLLGFGLKDFASIQLNERAIIIAGCSLLAGIGMMFLPASAWQHLHPMFSFLLGNGLLVGVLVCLLLEHVVFRKQKTALQEKDGSLP